jgi:hypothetical protein
LMRRGSAMAARLRLVLALSLAHSHSENRQGPWFAIWSQRQNARRIQQSQFRIHSGKHQAVAERRVGIRPAFFMISCHSLCASAG